MLHLRWVDIVVVSDLKNGARLLVASGICFWKGDSKAEGLGGLSII